MKAHEFFRFMFNPGSRLSHRVITAGAWTLAMRVSIRGLSLIRIVILARILSPEAFGLVAVGLLGIDLVQALSATGFNNALIQKKGNIRDYLDTAWVMSILRGLVTGGVLFFCAPLIARLFGSPDARPIVQVMASLVLISGFANSALVYLYKEMEIHKQFAWSLSQALAELAVTIPLALALRSPWALVYGAIVSNVVGVAMSYIIHPYRPRLKFDVQKARTLFQFGKWLTLSSWVNYMKGKGDSIFIGSLLGVSSLGLYQMARRVSDIYSVEIVIGTMNVVFPAYSKIQDNIPKLREAFLMSVEAITSMVLPLGVAIFMLAPLFTPVVFGEQWLPAVPAMQVLAIAAAFGCTLSISYSLFYGLGRPSLAFLMNVVSMVIMFGLFFPFYRLYGLTGGALAVLIGNIGSFPFFIYHSSKALQIRPRQFLRVTVAPLAISLLVLAASFVSLKYINIRADLIQLIVAVLLVGLFAAGSTFFLWKWFTLGPLQIIGYVRKKSPLAGKEERPGHLDYMRSEVP